MVLQFCQAIIMEWPRNNIIRQQELLKRVTKFIGNRSKRGMIDCLPLHFFCFGTDSETLKWALPSSSTGFRAGTSKLQEGTTRWCWDFHRHPSTSFFLCQPNYWIYLFSTEIFILGVTVEKGLGGQWATCALITASFAFPIRYITWFSPIFEFSSCSLFFLFI